MGPLPLATTKAEKVNAIREKRKQRRSLRKTRAFIDHTLPASEWMKDTRVKLVTKENKGEDGMHRLLNGMRVHFHKERPIEVDGKKYFIDFLITSIRAPEKKTIRIALEVDGGYHFTDEQRALDRKKDEALLRSERVNGVLRLSSDQATSFDRLRLTELLLSVPHKGVLIAY